MHAKHEWIDVTTHEELKRLAPESNTTVGNAVSPNGGRPALSRATPTRATLSFVCSGDAPAISRAHKRGGIAGPAPDVRGPSSSGGEEPRDGAEGHHLVEGEGDDVAVPG